MKKLGLLVLALSLLFVGSAFASIAADGTYKMTVDDAFELYISQDDHVQGTLIASGDHWPDAQIGTFYLAQGTNYIHVVGRDEHQVIAGFLGQFTLRSDNPYIFENGTKKLLTNKNDWTVRTDGWDDSFARVTSSGKNAGAEPWISVNGGPVDGISKNAKWIWTDKGDYTESPRYFSAKITMTPEPVSMVLFGLGAGVLGLAHFRRKKK
ncbi:MAG: PEP-CTERM sorting domain-containing protein [Candidatus Omnitrophota bacterium]